MTSSRFASLAELMDRHAELVRRVGRDLKAVEMSPEDGGLRDTRGLARALTGDKKGAIEDFEAYVNRKGAGKQQVEKRKRWVESLRKGVNPFTKEVLDGLRTEGEPVTGTP